MKCSFDLTALEVHSFWVLYRLSQSLIVTIVSLLNRFEMAQIGPF